MDFKSVQTIASVVENATVASLARCTKGDIDAAWDAVKEARHPRIHVFLATSDIHMEYKLRMTREQVLATITEMVGYAHSSARTSSSPPRTRPAPTTPSSPSATPTPSRRVRRR